MSVGIHIKGSAAGSGGGSGSGTPDGSTIHDAGSSAAPFQIDDTANYWVITNGASEPQQSVRIPESANYPDGARLEITNINGIPLRVYAPVTASSVVNIDGASTVLADPTMYYDLPDQATLLLFNLKGVADAAFPGASIWFGFDLGVVKTKADTDLGNLIATVINQSLIPDTTGTKDLGAPTLRWNNVYADFIRGSGAASLIINTAVRTLCGTSGFPVASFAGPDFDLANNKITTLATPTVATDAATKGYADSLVAGYFDSGAVTIAATTYSPANKRRQMIELTGSGGPVTLTDITGASPANGDELLIFGGSDTNTVTIADSTTVIVNGTATLGQNNSLTLVRKSSKWVEVTRSN